MTGWSGGFCCALVGHRRGQRQHRPNTENSCGLSHRSAPHVLLAGRRDFSGRTEFEALEGSLDARRRAARRWCREGVRVGRAAGPRDGRSGAVLCPPWAWIPWRARRRGPEHRAATERSGPEPVDAEAVGRRPREAGRSESLPLRCLAFLPVFSFVTPRSSRETPWQRPADPDAHCRRAGFPASFACRSTRLLYLPPSNCSGAVADAGDR